jgi:hypothetical protein
MFLSLLACNTPETVVLRGKAPRLEDSAMEDSEPDSDRPLSTDTGNGQNPQGVDVSHWDEEIDWEAVAEGGIGFTYIKATQGTDGETGLQMAIPCQEPWILSGTQGKGMTAMIYRFMR